MSESKQAKVYRFMDRRICEAVSVLCARHPDNAKFYSGMMNELSTIAA